MYWSRFKHFQCFEIGIIRIDNGRCPARPEQQFRRFGLIYNMTLGGPGHTSEILSLYVYKHYFKYFNFEYASGMAVVMAVIMLIISYPYIRMVARKA